MTDEQLLVDEIRRSIRAMSDSDQQLIESIAEEFRKRVVGDQRVALAFALVGAELAAECT